MSMDNVNWNLYKTFCAVFESGNKHSASDTLGITRSAIIQNVRELERQIGVQLFVSGARGVEPTESAVNLYKMVKTATETLANAPNAMRGDVGGGNIRLAVSNSSAEIMLKSFLKTWVTAHPEVNLEIVKREGLGLQKQKSLDFIIDIGHMIDKAEFKTVELFKITGAFIATRDFITRNKLKMTISRDALFRLPIITREVAWKDFTDINPCASSVKITKSASTDMTFSMARDGIGIGYFGKELMDKFPTADLCEIAVADVVQPMITFVAGYAKPLSKNARLFIDEFKKYCVKP